MLEEFAAKTSHNTLEGEQYTAAILAKSVSDLESAASQTQTAIEGFASTFTEQLRQLTLELARSREQSKENSDVTTRQTTALVSWTRVLVFATIAYVVLTGGLLLATLVQ